MFTDSIPKGIRIRELNIFITNDKVKLISSPGATSKEILHYVDVHLTNSSADNADNLGNNLKFIIGKCHTYGFKKVFISGLVYTARTGLPVLQRTHERTEHLCNKLGICYLDNINIRR